MMIGGKGNKKRKGEKMKMKKKTNIDHPLYASFHLKVDLEEKGKKKMRE